MPLSLADRRPVGSTALSLPPLGYGSAHLGGMFARVDGEQARATLGAAWDGGIRYYDSAPFYGLGLSEHRLGSFLMDKPRSEFLVTTKVGRILHRPKDLATFDRTPWGGGLNFEIEFDYSHDGVMRAYEQSLMRLGLDTVDALLIHDLDAAGHGEHFAGRLKDLLDSGVKALDELKRAGEIKAVGMGINVTESLDEIAPLVDLDFVLVAMPYTLIDQAVLHTGLARCVEKGIGVVIGAPFASGILATGPGPNARYRYAIAPEPVQRKAARIEAVCRSHGVPLATAALRFVLAHPAVVSTIPGAVRPSEIAQNIAAVTAAIPPALWAELKAEGLIDPEAPVEAA